MAFDHIGGAEPSTLTFKLRTVSGTFNSSKMHAEILHLGDQTSSLAIAAVLGSAPASTAWALAVRQVGDASVAQGSTVWAVQLTQYSTTVAVSSVGGVVTIKGNSTVHQGTSPWVVSLGAEEPTVHVGTQPNAVIASVLDSSGGLVVVGDSANNALRVNVVAGSAGSTTVNVSSLAGIVTIAGNSSVAQASTTWAVQMTQYSTTVNVSSLGGAVIVRSSAADFGATVTQASTVWAVQLTQWSTQVAVSSVAGVVIVRSSAANALGTVYQSTAADLQATVTAQSGFFVVRSSAADFSATVSQGTASNLLAKVDIRDGSGNVLESGIVKPSSAARALYVRQVFDDLDTFASTSVLATTSAAVASSQAAMRIYVTAYTITSTNQTPAHWGFFSSNATLLWPITLASISSAVSGANLAVAPPGYLFRTAAADALNFKSAGSTVAGVQFACSYFKST